MKLEDAKVVVGMKLEFGKKKAKLKPFIEIEKDDAKKELPEISETWKKLKLPDLQ